jgi:glycosyltransferase involved in cell wall biosynthesis
MAQNAAPTIRQIAVIGTHLPRQCGIATFTTDFCEALVVQAPGAHVFAVAINDTAERYDYPSRVRFEIGEQDLGSYRKAADFLNTNGVDLVVLQHEYGIFGGPAGSHVLGLLHELRMPIVSVLHTVLAEPDRIQRKVLSEIVRLSDRVVIMSRYAQDILRDLYHAPLEKVAYIPHGIPDVPFVDPNYFKDQYNAEGKEVLLTFGLLSPNKGIEYVIGALPAILQCHPNVLYIVLGATHPHVRRFEGEAYRKMLHRLAREHGVERNVVFYNQFVALEELVAFIGAADIYITPYLNPDQIVSGALAYTVGAGKAVISTPYRHANELLGDGRGVLVPFRDSAAIAEQVIGLLDDGAERHATRKRAYTFGRDMTWPRVAQEYLGLFAQVRADRMRAPCVNSAPRRLKRPLDLPPLSLGHLMRMTDGTGLLQHATFSVPNYREGYATDDNARALFAVVLLEEVGLDMPENVRKDLAMRYLAFLSSAFDSTTDRFHNFLSYDRRWLDDVGSEDSQGRAIWALGTVIGRSANRGHTGLASQLFGRALPAVLGFTSARAWAFTLLGICEYLKRFGGDRGVQRIRDELAARLARLYEETSSVEWPWFEEVLTYDNATLPRGLLLAGHTMQHDGYIATALRALTWLVEIQSDDQGHFVPVGCHGFYRRGEARARFDQQPIEAYATISACLDARRVTGDIRWEKQAHLVFDWFLGQNDLGIPLIDPATGACYDGLQPDGANQNQGAESALAFLLARLDLRLAEAEQTAAGAAREAVRMLTEKAASARA